MTHPLRSIAIGGVGLMGGSLGLRLRSLPNPSRVTAFGRTEATLRRALERGAIDAWSVDPAEAVRDADLVVLCAPVRSIPDQISSIAFGLSRDAIVTDVGSTKEWITGEADRRLPPRCPLRRIASNGGLRACGDRIGRCRALRAGDRDRDAVTEIGRGVTESRARSVALGWFPHHHAFR